MKFLVIGASGFLGRKIITLLSKKHEIIKAGIRGGEDTRRVDATNKEEVRKLILETRPDVVIDTVALTSSLSCEMNPYLAKKLNYLSAKNILECCEEVGSKMVFISSNYIFNGEKGNYSEEDVPDPLNEYGKTKVMAEEVIMKNKNHIIIRADLMYGFNGKGLPNGIVDKVLSGEEIEIRDLKQKRTPIFVDDVVMAIEKLVEMEQEGIFNLSGEEEITYFDFLKKLEKVVRKDSKIVAGFPEKEKKIRVPELSTLNNSKIKSLGIKITPINEAIDILKTKIN